MKKIFSHIWKTSPVYTAVLLMLSFAAGLATPFMTWMETSLINAVTVVAEASFSWNEDIFFLILCLLVIYAFAYLLPPFLRYLQQSSSLKLDERVKAEIQNKINKLEYKTLEEPLFRDKWNRVTGKIEEKLQELFTAVSDSLVVAVSVTGLFAYVASVSVKIMLFYIVESAVLFYISKLAAKALFRLNKKFSSSERQVLYLNNITNSKEYAAERKLFQYTPFINEKRTEFMKTQRIEQRHHDFKFAICSSGIEVMGYIATIVIMIMIFPQLKDRTITLGFFLAFARVTLNMNNIMQYKVKTLLDIMSGQQIFWREYNELIETVEKEDITYEGDEDESNSNDVKRPDAVEKFSSIEFRNVSFTYPNGTQVLKNASFYIENGKHYALVGENGAGKSTIVKLLLGLYEPTDGEILINGYSIRKFSRTELQKFCAVVFQDFVKYAIPFGENILLNQECNEEKYSKVLSYVGLAEVEKSLENGKHTLLGKIEQGGKDLSGGEWQKLAIARALYKDSPFVVFDEPTASLDPIAESALYREYYTMMKGKTTVFISHRLASATLADEILVLADKKICEVGTHKELLTRNGVYYKLFMAQRRWYWGELSDNA